MVLTAKLALARERLRRGDSRADESLAELQRDLGFLLGQLRDYAHAIHPPVLTTRACARPADPRHADYRSPRRRPAAPLPPPGQLHG